jgi:hypothetical protein
MPETTIEIRVSWRELDRPRLIEGFVCDVDGAGVADVIIRLQIDENGTFDDADGEPRTQHEAVSGSSGHFYFQWYEYPREGPRRDMTSVVAAICWRDDVFVYLQDLYE